MILGVGFSIKRALAFPPFQVCIPLYMVGVWNMKVLVTVYNDSQLKCFHKIYVFGFLGSNISEYFSRSVSDDVLKCIFYD